MKFDITTIITDIGKDIISAAEEYWQACIIGVVILFGYIIYTIIW